MRLGELAVRFGLTLRGDPDATIDRVGTLAAAGPDALAFLANPLYRKYVATSRAGAIIVAPDNADGCPGNVLVSDNPYADYARIATELHPAPSRPPGVAPGAFVAPGVEVPASAHVGHGAVVEEDAQLGERVVIGPGCLVGRGVTLGDDCELVANVTLCQGVRLGHRVLVHPGAVIGSDGFGIARDGERWIKVPQVGSVQIGDDVEIGASTTIDRGAIDDTVLGDGVKLDNQIQVAHNVEIGDHTVIAACSGISGSTRIGKRCMIAGAVGFVGHLDIADDVIITGQTMVNRSIGEAGVYSSALPMDEAKRWRRNSARFRQLDDIAKRLKAVEKKLK